MSTTGALMDAGTSGGSGGGGSTKAAAVKLIPKRWRKRPSNDSFGSLVSAENEEHPRERRPSTRDSQQGGSRPGSLSTTQSTEAAGRIDDDDDDDDDDGVDAGRADHDALRDSAHEL